MSLLRSTSSANSRARSVQNQKYQNKKPRVSFSLQPETLQPNYFNNTYEREREKTPKNVLTCPERRLSFLIHFPDLWILDREHAETFVVLAQERFVEYLRACHVVFHFTLRCCCSRPLQSSSSSSSLVYSLNFCQFDSSIVVVVVVVVRRNEKQIILSLLLFSTRTTWSSRVLFLSLSLSRGREGDR